MDVARIVMHMLWKKCQKHKMYSSAQFAATTCFRKQTKPTYVGFVCYLERINMSANKTITILLVLIITLILTSCVRNDTQKENLERQNTYNNYVFAKDENDESLVTIYSGTRYQVVPLVPSGNGCFVQKVYLLDKDGNVAGQGNLEGFRYSLDGKLYVSPFSRRITTTNVPA